MRITLDDILSDFHGNAHAMSPQAASSPVPLPAIHNSAALHPGPSGELKSSTCGLFYFGGVAEWTNVGQVDNRLVIRHDESPSLAKADCLPTDFVGSNPTAAILSFSAILGIILALFALTACGAPVLKWTANTETNLAGYNLYIGSDCIFSINTNRFDLATIQVPLGVYPLRLTAVTLEGVESEPAGPLMWTNGNVLFLSIEASRDLLEWNAIGEPRTVLSTNAFEFYRAVLRFQ